METRLHSLAYYSRNAIAGERGEIEAEIERLLVTARAANAACGITGALLYSDGYFAQVIEGPRAAVEAMFERIEVDWRHRDIALLHLKPIDARAFDGWSMAFAGIAGHLATPFDIKGILAHPDAIAAAAAGRALVATLRELIAKHDASGGA